MKPPEITELDPPGRILMGPGPSNVHPRVLRSMSTPVIGHLDPGFIDIMNDVQELLRYVLQTNNKWTIPVSGTGSASMEAAVMNLVEPGDSVLVPSNGYFGDRMKQMAQRAGSDVREIDAEWGESLDSVDVEEALDEHQPDVFGFVHAETSTGALQPNPGELVDLAHHHDALVIVDTVTSLGGVEVDVDSWGADAVYSAAQKCLSCPPGASPLTVNDSALDKILSREEPVRSWYLDLSLLESYWGDDRSYHHTAPISSIYALREALRLVAEEGLQNRWNRHWGVARALRDGVEGMGLEMNADEDSWLPTLNAVRIPDGVDADKLVKRMLEEHGVEIAGGLGDLAGDIVRIGCMGYSARPENVYYLLHALSVELGLQGFDADFEDGMVLAREAFQEIEVGFK